MQYQINGQYHNVDIELEKVKLSAIISCYDHFKSTNNYDQAREYPKVCVNLQTGVRYNYSVWRFLLWQEEKVTHHRKQQCAK